MKAEVFVYSTRLPTGEAGLLINPSNVRHRAYPVHESSRERFRYVVPGSCSALERSGRIVFVESF